MKNFSSFIRFAGRLCEDMTFERKPTWETNQIADRPPKGDGQYQIDLLDKNGKIIVSVSPQVEFNQGCIERESELKFSNVVAYIPCRKEGIQLVFRKDVQTIYKESLSEKPPTIKITQLQISKNNRISLKWKSKHPEKKKLTFTIVYWLKDQKRAFLVRRGINGTEYSIDFSHLPGTKQGCIGILATDGCRSSYTVSKNFVVENKKPLIWIQSPMSDQVFPADQTINLSGQAVDVAGQSLPQENLIWKIDGKIISKGFRLFHVQGLKPGSHSVSLHYSPKSETLSHETIKIRIANRSKEQERFIKIINDRKKRKPNSQDKTGLI